MKNFFCFLLVVQIFSIDSQTQFIGIKSGMNFSRIDNYLLYQKTNFKTGYSGGFTYEKILKEKFSFTGEMIFNQRGFVDNVVLTDNTGAVIDDNFKIKYCFNYFSINLKTGYKFGKKKLQFVNLGLVTSAFLYGNSRFSIYDDNTKKNGIQKERYYFDQIIDFAGLIEFGSAYEFKNKMQVYAVTSFQLSFNGLRSKSTTEMNFHDYWLSLSFGLKYPLGAKME